MFSRFAYFLKYIMGITVPYAIYDINVTKQNYINKMIYWNYVNITRFLLWIESLSFDINSISHTPNIDSKRS